VVASNPANGVLSVSKINLRVSNKVASSSLVSNKAVNSLDSKGVNRILRRLLGRLRKLQRKLKGVLLLVQGHVIPRQVSWLEDR